MGRYLGSWKLEDIIYVPVQTSAATTGAAADAESVPTWRMYEDNTATPVTTGSFTTLNAQTGFYISAITLAAAIGYEKGKSYSLRVQATVNGIIGADVHNLQIEAEVDTNTLSAALPAVTVNATSNAAIADAVWSETASGYTTAGSMGFVLQDAQSLNAIVAAVAAAVTAGSIGPVTVGSTSRAAIVDEVWDEPKAGHTTADTYGEYLDTTIGAVKAKTDLLFAGTGNSIAADIKYVNGVSVTGNGQSGTEWGAGS